MNTRREKKEKSPPSTDKYLAHLSVSKPIVVDNLLIINIFCKTDGSRRGFVNLINVLDLQLNYKCSHSPLRYAEHQFVNISKIHAGTNWIGKKSLFNETCSLEKEKNEK